MKTIQPDQIHEVVQARYGRLATNFEPVPTTQNCERENKKNYFADLYTAEDWQALPVEVTGLSLGCGDPITLANLQPGQVVLDLGSGGGIDCFLAAKQVGETGHVIGIDMTPAMLEKAEANKAQLGVKNVTFRQGYIESLPVADDTADVIISNCVINLSPNKETVFAEAFRVLKPGGYLAISDMVRQGEFTAEERADMVAWSGCIAGAETVTFYAEGLRAAGFVRVSIRERDAAEVELVDVVATQGPARLFSARITAEKPA